MTNGYIVSLTERQISVIHAALLNMSNLDFIEHWQYEDAITGHTLDDRPVTVAEVRACLMATAMPVRVQ
jgi:hypothetical protein